MEAQLSSAPTGHAVVAASRDLIEEHGELGEDAVRNFARDRGDVVYDEEHGVVAAFDSNEGSVKLAWIVERPDPAALHATPESAAEAFVGSLGVVIGNSPSPPFDPSIFDGLFLIREDGTNWIVVRERGKREYFALTILGVRGTASYSKSAEWLEEQLRLQAESDTR